MCGSRGAQRDSAAWILGRWLALSALALIPIDATADDTATTLQLSSGTVLPASETSVQMVSEEVTYRAGQFRTDFVLKNVTSRPVTVTVGFPVVGEVERAGESLLATAPLPGVPEVEKRLRIESAYAFASLLDDQPLRRELVPVKTGPRAADAESGYDYMYVATIAFEPQQVRRLQNFYSQARTQWVDSMGASGWTLTYFVHTGTSWAGPIENGLFRFFVERAPMNKRLTLRGTRYQSGRWNVEPADYTTEEHGALTAFVWRLGRFEPNFDIRIRWADACDHDVSLPDYDTLRAVVAKPAEACSLFHETFLKTDPWTYARTLAEDQGWRSEADGVARFAINLIYALHGYRFKEVAWRQAFSCFPWYRPKTLTPALSPEFRGIVDELRKLDKDSPPAPR